MHLTCTHSAVGLVSSHASFPICASSLPHDLPTIVSLVPAQQQWPNFQSRSQFFPPPAARLSLASSLACGGPRRAILGQLSGGGVFLLHDSSRPARRTAKAWRLRPACGTAPRVSGSHRSVLHRPQWCRRRRHVAPSPPPPPPPLAVASACPGHTTLEAVSSKRGHSACRARDTRRAARAPVRAPRLLFCCVVCALKI